jgi:hypothetical protein
MTKRKVLIVARMFFGLLTLVAIGIQLTIYIRAGLSTVNYFSRFTNLSNLLAAVVLISEALSLIKYREPTALDDIIRGISVVCMVLVSIIYSVLFRLSLGHQFPWAITYYIMPVVVLLDWLYQPPQSRPATKQIFYWLIFPLLYLGYLIFRGKITGFYPYPFFNTDEMGGYGGVALYCVAILAVFLFVNWLLLTLGNQLKRNVT